MTRDFSHRHEVEKPIYSLVWEQLKNFPKGLAEGSKNPPTVSG